MVARGFVPAHPTPSAAVIHGMDVVLVCGVIVHPPLEELDKGIRVTQVQFMVCPLGIYLGDVDDGGAAFVEFQDLGVPVLVPVLVTGRCYPQGLGLADGPGDPTPVRPPVA